jgi:trehalose 6-phosphate synthase/phosphatase
MGIDVGALRVRRREPDVSYWVQLLRQRYAGMMIVVGRDKLDEIQGVKHKLEAFELFLKKWPEYQGKVCFLFLSLFILLFLLPIRKATRTNLNTTTRSSSSK